MKFYISILFLFLTICSCGQTTVKEAVSPSQYPNFKIQFIDQRNGWIIGSNILRTQNGGSSWAYIPSVAATPILASDGPAPVRYFVQFVDSIFGWRLCSLNNQHSVQYSKDGGYSWENPIFVAPNLHSKSLLFVTQDKGWVFGYEKAFSTNNRGESWTEEEALAKGSLYYPFALNKNQIWVASEHGMLAQTSDGGNNWTIQKTIPHGIVCIFFLSQLKGWGVGKEGLIAKTEDGGRNWSINEIQLPNMDNSQKPMLLDVFFLNAEIGWIVGDGGIILRTVNGGKSWLFSSTPTRATLGSVRFVNRQQGWAVGGNPKPVIFGSPTNLILTSTDGGATWQTLHL